MTKPEISPEKPGKSRKSVERPPEIPGATLESPESIRKRKIASIVCVVAIVLIFVAITWFVGVPLVRQFRKNPENFQNYVQSHGFLGKLLMIGIVMLQIVVAFIPGEPFELGAGFVFGWLEGGILCLIGSALAAALIYSAVKKWGTKVVTLFFPMEKIMRFSFLKNEKKRALMVFILFLIPGTPKDLLVYLVGLTPMKLFSFLWISSLARIPSIISSTITGSLTQKGRFSAAIITYGITGVITVLCILWYRRVSKLNPDNEPTQAEGQTPEEEKTVS